MVTANTQAVAHAAFLRCIHMDFFLCSMANLPTVWELHGPLLNLTHGNKASTSAVSKRQRLTSLFEYTLTSGMSTLDWLSSTSDCHGFQNPSGFWVGYTGVRVWVGIC
jgi:hypothetical protein